jgi:hypothetical protein
MKNKIVAIVGKNDLNWDLAPFDNLDVDIWGLGFWAAMGKYPRLDAVFEVHRREVWEKEITIPVDEYLAWLKEPHPFPIYTREKQDYIASCEVLPLNLISERYLRHLFRGVSPIVRYYTTSIAYMLAMAIYLGYTRIEPYGIEMTAERYQYQRDSVFYWMGLANGNGVDVVVPENSDMFMVNSYGDGPDPFLVEDERMRAEAEHREHERLKDMKSFYTSPDGIAMLHKEMKQHYQDLVERDKTEHGAGIYLQGNDGGQNVTEKVFEDLKAFYGPDMPGATWTCEAGQITVRIDHSK